MKTGYITHSDYLKHQMIEGHPEQPARLLAIQDQLQAHQLGDFLAYFEPQNASKGMLLRVHTEEHIEYLFKNAPQAGQTLFHVDPDTFMNEHTLNAALKAAGASVMAVDQIMEKKIDNAFCAVRPPGHHAERDRELTLLKAGYS